MAKELRCVVSESTWTALEAERVRTGDSLSHVVQRAISDGLGLTHHSIFQVSTSTAVVEGVFGGYVTVAELKQHGDFGLGTFDGLDGEMIMVDGECYQATNDGVVNRAEPEWGVPFGVVTRFEEDLASTVDAESSFVEFQHLVDTQRPSENLFVGIRAEVFALRMSLRAACKAAPGEGLVEAVQHQSEFSAKAVHGTLVGFWTPTYASAFNVPGYHFHFLDDDREFGGHVLDMDIATASVSLHLESDMHVVLPETAEFLSADLRTDPTTALEITE
jgi:acetolactate decarboxylase